MYYIVYQTIPPFISAHFGLKIYLAKVEAASISPIYAWSSKFNHVLHAGKRGKVSLALLGQTILPTK